MKTKREALEAMKRLRPFIGAGQLGTVAYAMQGEEGQFFIDKMCELDAMIAAMPKTGDESGMVYLHYFAGGSANFWITEKDIDGDGAGQVQAFGLANLFGGPDGQDAELGYISISEILAAGAELDFHFRPRTLTELKEKAQCRSLAA